jgi:hypothetical protein
LRVAKFEIHFYAAGDNLRKELDAGSYKGIILLPALFSDTFYGELAAIMAGDPESAMARDDI